ncbi:sodium-independent sulfate anion transporter-like isoform X2 [Tigriopus californicus]|uniref:sodium-independent sulfate anion transporter-like isoform X2 n=1 Tax=Tigriopus californicus TaxID=6832 RepID=UPI0027DA5947|nr:sodium-independent sulfate anion transporter-like isoform X2 [Tigriopus californicus]
MSCGQKDDEASSSSGMQRDHTVIRVPHRKRSSLTRKRTKRFLDQGCRRVSSKAFWFQKLPCLEFARNYDLSCLVGDMVAGVTVALTVIPQGIGYAPLAGLPLQYGLYAAIVPAFVYAVLGTCKESNIGPTAVNALMSFNYAGNSVVHAVALAFFSGIIEILAGCFKLGFLVHFISSPVISAFTSAVSIQVATSQVKGLLGLQISSRGFINTWIGVFQNMDRVRPCDAALGFTCIGILLFLRKVKDTHWCEGPDPETIRARFFAKFKWMISISRNCVIVILSAVIAYVLTEVYEMKDVLILTGEVVPGLPSIQLPWQIPTQNQTIVTPAELVSDLGIGIIMVPIVSFLQHLAIAKFYASGNKAVDASQEMVALGVSQFLGSFVGSLPVTSAFSRSAVNSSSGVRTTFGGILTGIIVLMTCSFLTPHFGYIPKSALSAVIISAVIFIVDIEILLPIWRSKKIDLVPFCLTFFLGLFVRVEVGMIVGTLVHLSMLIFTASRPKVTVKEGQIDNIPYILVTPDRGLFFPSVDEIRTKILEIVQNNQSNETHLLTPIIMDMSQVREMDYTAASGIRGLTKSLKKSGQHVYFCCVDESIEEILQGVDSSLFLAYVNLQDAEQKIRGS